MDLFTQLFTDLNTTDSLLFLLFLFLSFLIGLVTGRASLRGALKRLQKKQTQQETELRTLQEERNALVEQTKVQEAALQTTEDNLRQSDLQLRNAQKSIQEHEALGQKYRDSIAQWESSWTALETQEQAQRQQIAELEESLAQQKAQASTSSSNTSPTSERLLALEEKLIQLEADRDTWRNNLYSETNEVDGTTGSIHSLEWQSLQQRLLQVEQDNEDLRTTIQGLQGEEEVEVDIDLSFYDQQSRVQEARARLKALYGQRIARAEASQKEDLQRIEGIGPFIEKQLHEIGIYTFQQISQFDEEIIALVTEAIQFFPGRIAKDQWKEQASRQLN